MYSYMECENGITQGIEDVQNFHFAVRRNHYVRRCISRFREFLRLRKAINFVVVGDVLRQEELYSVELLFIFAKSDSKKSEALLLFRFADLYGRGIN